MGESDLTMRLGAEGLAPGRWENGPGDQYAAHRHPYDKVIICVRGSITFGLPGRGGSFTLEAGDRLELPAGIDHDADVGSAGVTCLEAHLPAGQPGRDPVRRAAGSW